MQMWKSGARRGHLASWLVNFAVYVLLQGMLYMTPGERAFKIGLTFLFATILAVAGLHPIPALALGHLFNFLLNGHLPCLTRYVKSETGLPRRKVTSTFEMLSRSAKSFGIIDVLVFGSFSRHEMKLTSDLDLRFYHRPDFVSSCLAYVYTTYVRAWASIKGIPIDVYCFSQTSYLDRMRADEVPSLLYTSDEMQRKYPDHQDPIEALEKNTALP